MRTAPDLAALGRLRPVEGGTYPVHGSGGRACDDRGAEADLNGCVGSLALAGGWGSSLPEREAVELLPQ